MTNIWNPGHVVSYLQEFAGDDDYLLLLLHAALAKPLLKDPECVIKITQLPVDAPTWMIEKWEARGPWHEWRPSTALQEKVRHITDWIKNAQINGADWLRNTDHKNRPHKLLKLRTIDDVSAVADSEMRELSRRLEDLKEVEGTTEVVKEWPDAGYRMVRLLTPEALRRESGMMGHCIGHGAHDEHLETGEYEYYSLRDGNNRAHATLEILTHDNRLTECKGKQNTPPVTRYMPFIQEFILEKHLKLDEEPKNTGLIQIGKEYFEIHTLPDNLIIDGHIFEQLIAAGVTNFPENMTVTGGVNLAGKTMAVFPSGTFSGNVNLRNAHIGLMKSGVSVSYGLEMSRAEIDAFEPNFKIRADIDMSYVRARLPEGYTQRGNLVLDHYEHDELPEHMTVEGELDLGETHITNCPRHFTTYSHAFAAIEFDSIDGGDHLTLIGDISLRDVTRERTPSYTKIVGNFDLSDVSIWDVGEGLEVTGKTRVAGLWFDNLEEALAYLKEHPFELPPDMEEYDADYEETEGQDFNDFRL